MWINLKKQIKSVLLYGQQWQIENSIILNLFGLKFQISLISI